MENYIVLHYSKDVDIDTVYDLFKGLQEVYPQKECIALPNFTQLKNYSKEELIELKDKYLKKIEELINE